MHREPPTDQPAHRFEDVEDVEAECVDCDRVFEAVPDSFEVDGVSVLCPDCGERIFVVLE
ncbi:hypothetical protein GCM10010915_12150 [Microbacterium faecale]|uniref:Uncharacterized protein n=1 Tax=Microbacterium faecale TaxID=1804630 RepID=A0A916Y7M0_9MICO|nr:hypothetical protein GCM10010915_12150 [Microbacterium faecale]